MAGGDRDDFGKGGSDRTVIRPNPGGRRPEPRPQGPASTPPPPVQQQPVPPAIPSAPGVPHTPLPGLQPPPPGAAPPLPDSAGQRPLPGSLEMAAGTPPVSFAQIRSVGINPLVNAAIAPLSLITQLRHAAQHPDVEGLHRQLVEQLTQFEADARGASVSPETVNAARYCLCTALDEVVLSTPWGAASIWRAQSLLVTFHKEAWGGEKFFHVLEAQAQDPGRNVDLLEFLYIILCLGFQGKYRVLEQGEARLEDLRNTLFQRLRPYRGEYERDLSPHWQGETRERRRSVGLVPVWVAAALAGALVLTTYIGMDYVLTQSSDSVRDKLQTVAAQSADES